MTLLAIREGMTADNLLKIHGRDAEYAVDLPTPEGDYCVWHYVDCDVVMAYYDGAWRVKEIRRKQ